MCYDAEYKLRSQIKEAIHQGMPEEEIDELKRQLWILTGDPWYDPDADPDDEDEWPELEDFDYYHTSGFSNPVIGAYTSINPHNMILAHWSFIAPGIRSYEEAYDYKSPGWVRNLNAISENMFQPRKVFRDAAKWGRCVVRLDGYYEHHHYKGKTYPCLMKRKDGKPFYAAAIHRETYLIDKDGDELKFNSLAILTCRANENSLMSRIHNNPTMLKRGNGHRMLVLLHEDQVADYLKPYPVPRGEKGDPAEEKLFQEEILSLCKPYPDQEIEWHTVINIKNRKNSPYIGNVPEITKPYQWPALDYASIEPNELF